MNYELFDSATAFIFYVINAVGERLPFPTFGACAVIILPHRSFAELTRRQERGVGIVLFASDQ